MPARRYTDQQFRDAVADPDVHTVADLCRALGVVPRGGNYATMRAVAQRLAVELPESVRVPAADRRHHGGPRPVCSDHQLLDALADPGITSYRALVRRLGIGPHSNNYRRLQRRATKLGHRIPDEWSRPGPSIAYVAQRAIPYYEPARLATAVAAAGTRRDVLEALGEAVNAASYKRLRRALETSGLDTSHLHRHANRSRPIDEYLVEGRLVSTSKLRTRLIAEELLAATCNVCGRTRWNECPIPLELDHVNGDRFDNRVENLQLLCPNCHAQTETYRGRNMGRRSGCAAK